MQKDVILTPEGLEKLKQEIEYLSTTKRREVAERIKEAREFGDISENSEYDDAKNEQAMLESRIATLEDKLRSASVIDASELSADVVRVGSLGARQGRRTGKSLTYTIVGSTEADPSANRLSNESPVGKALVGRKKGDTVKVTLPNGKHARADRHQDRSRMSAARRGALRTPRHPPPQARGAAGGGHRPVPARLPGRARRSRRSRRRMKDSNPARRPTCACASPAACTRAAARARPRSSTSSTAPGGSSCTRASTCSARSRSTRLV